LSKTFIAHIEQNIRVRHSLHKYLADVASCQTEHQSRFKLNTVCLSNPIAQKSSGKS